MDDGQNVPTSSRFLEMCSVRLSDSFVIEKLASAMGLLTNKDELHCTSMPNHQMNDT
jgi:hypothetical protein